MKTRFIIIFVFCFASVQSQTVLLDVDRKQEQRRPESGPNTKTFSHAFFRLGAVASGDFEGARIAYGSSLNLAVGARKKYKITRAISAGYDLEINYTDYKLLQRKGKILPDTILFNKSERLDFAGPGLGFFTRINFDPQRGNTLGGYLDIGIAGLWNASIKRITKNKLPDGTLVKTVLKNLTYVNDIDAKLIARIGKNHFSLYASYRLTEYFKPSFNYPDLPRVVIGIEAAAF